jgi:hypothetical protein
MQVSNWIFVAGISMGVVFAVFGYRRGFFATWAILFNIIIAIYASVMLSPTIAAMMPTVFSAEARQAGGNFWYWYAGLAATVGVLSFIILQVIAITYFTGTFNITLHRLLESLGAAFLGFASGYILWGFICFLVLIMPVSENVIFKSFTEDTRLKQSQELARAVSTAVNTVNMLSLQPDRQQVRNVITWTLGWEVKGEPNETK